MILLSIRQHMLFEAVVLQGLLTESESVAHPEIDTLLLQCCTIAYCTPFDSDSGALEDSQLTKITGYGCSVRIIARLGINKCEIKPQGERYGS